MLKAQVPGQLFYFFGTFVRVETTAEAVIGSLRAEFKAFIYNEKLISERDLFVLKIYHEEASCHLIPEIKTSFHDKRLIIYDVNQARFCDYYGKVVTANFWKKREVIVYTLDESLAFEKAKLIIHSWTRKALELRGFHPLTAFAVIFKNQWTLVCTTPPREENALLNELLKDSRVQLVAKKRPLIDHFGNVHSDMMVPNFQNTYFEKPIFIEAVRINSSHAFLGTTTLLRAMRRLLFNGVLDSEGLLEYYWANNPREFFVKCFVLCRRIISFLVFSIKSKCLRLHLGKHPEKAAKEILYYLDKITSEK